MNSPNINVTPLIDVLLVLLIIFMVISPLKPTGFKARVPSKPSENVHAGPNPNTLVASLENDGKLRLNNETDVGTIGDPAKLTARLESEFEQRIANGNISYTYAGDPERPTADRIERTVFIKASKKTGYGQVARLIDAVKSAGAYPISLQIDGLP